MIKDDTILRQEISLQDCFHNFELFVDAFFLFFFVSADVVFLVCKMAYNC